MLELFVISQKEILFQGEKSVTSTVSLKYLKNTQKCISNTNCFLMNRYSVGKLDKSIKKLLLSHYISHPKAFTGQV